MKTLDFYRVYEKLIIIDNTEICTPNNYHQLCTIINT